MKEREGSDLVELREILDESSSHFDTVFSERVEDGKEILLCQFLSNDHGYLVERVSEGDTNSPLVV